MKKNARKNKEHIRERCITMSNETTDRMINAGVADIDYLKIHTAESLEEAARNLRRADVADKGEDIKQILQDIEDQVNRLKGNLDKDYQKIESDFHKNTKPVEQVITSHPVPSVLIAAGAGILLGILISKVRN